MGYQYKSEEQLLEDLRKRDEEAISYFYEKNWPMARAHVINNSGSEEDAEDCYQESFIIFMIKINEPEFEIRSLLSTYLFGIVKYHWSNQLRNRNKGGKMEPPPNNVTHPKEPEEEFNLPSDEEIQAMVNELDPECKDIMIDFYYLKISMKELAERYNIASEGAARKRKFKCLQKLKKLFGV